MGSFAATVFDQFESEYVFDSGVFLRDGEGLRVQAVQRELTPLPADLIPMLTLGTRVYVDGDGAARFCVSVREPEIERLPIGILLRRTVRQVQVKGPLAIVWRLIALMDGRRSVSEMLQEFPECSADVNRLLAILVATEVVDASGHCIGRFLHTATKREVLPSGVLDEQGIASLVTDGNYRSFPGAQQLPMGQTRPQSLDTLDSLLRRRRSLINYDGSSVRSDDFQGLLSVACGETGKLSWSGREVRLRAYPSAGALYAVEIYPVVFAVEGLPSAIFHYHVVDRALEIVRTGIDRTAFVNVAIPEQRELIQGVAAIVCLTGIFDRFARKYGEGGYRMLAAEAGHISENIILAATAVGLHARPCGGFFEKLINRELGLESSNEQFLLAVLIGNASGRQENNEESHGVA